MLRCGNYALGSGTGTGQGKNGVGLLGSKAGSRECACAFGISHREVPAWGYLDGSARIIVGRWSPSRRSTNYLQVVVMERRYMRDSCPSTTPSLRPSLHPHPHFHVAQRNSGTPKPGPRLHLAVDISDTSHDRDPELRGGCGCTARAYGYRIVLRVVDSRGGGLDSRRVLLGVKGDGRWDSDRRLRELRTILIFEKAAGRS